MAYVQPNSRILLLSGTGLSPDYMHTYRFKSESDQSSFFLGKKYKDFENQSYQRVDKNSLKIMSNAQNLYSCDYLMFQNQYGTSGLSAKWYYAFITSVEYVNEVTTLIRYQIDEIQTWLIRLISGLQPCFIIREHSAMDGLYSNTQPEPVDIGGEYQYESQKWNNLAVKPSYVSGDNDIGGTGTFGGWLPCMCFYRDRTGPGVVTGVPTTLTTRSYKYLTGGGKNSKAFWDDFSQIPDEDKEQIVDMFMYPEALLSKNPGASGNVITQTVTKSGKGKNNAGNPWKDYFTPKNQKLYTYPYCYILVTDNCGKNVEYKNEYFARDLDTAIFDISGTFGPDPEFLCMAREYNETQTHAGMNGLTLSGVPKMPWVTDSYKVYMAQNSSSIRTNNVLAATAAIKGIAQMGQSAFQAASGDIDADSLSDINGDAAFSGLASMAQNKARLEDARKMTDNIHTASGPSVLYLDGLLGFSCYMARIPVEYAQRIDNYFSMYGYATNQIRKPDIFTRKYFNYLQATNISISSKVPARTKTIFASVLAKGITFWDKSATIGNYNLDNSPGGN